MRKRTGDWRDLLSAYDLALEGNKIYVGFIATVLTVMVMAGAAFLYAQCADWGLVTAASDEVCALGELAGPDSVVMSLVGGRGLEMLGTFVPLLNPFHGGVGHFVFSLLLYAVLFWVWSGAGGIISRLAVLEYARDDLPTLSEARRMVRANRGPYVLALLWPLIVIAVCSLLNAVGGLIASIPYLGRILLVFPGYPLLVISTGAIVFVVVVTVVGFVMIVPGISTGGRGGLESWITACSYVMYGLRHFVCYTLLAGVIGVVAAVVAWGLAELLILLMYQTVNIGFVHSTSWLVYQAHGADIALLPVETGGFYGLFSIIMVLLLLLVRALPAAYVFSYFFAAGTVIFCLMRKEVDNIEIEEVYEEEEEEEAGAEVEEAAEEPAAEAAEQAPPEEEATEEESAAEEEAPETEQEAPQEEETETEAEQEEE